LLAIETATRCCNGLNKAQDVNAAAVQPGLLLARYYIDRGDYLQALTVARNLSTRFPDNVSALEMLGRVQTLVGEQADAISTFDQILSTEPNDARVHYLKGGAQ
jgi:Flp pilus assembly protein TadD